MTLQRSLPPCRLKLRIWLRFLVFWLPPAFLTLSRQNNGHHFESLERCVVSKKDTESSKIYTNYNSKHRDQVVSFNQKWNPMNNYLKSGGSIVAFIFCILFVNSVLAFFK
ncbi:unnamed protein product [Mucor hiemalis]